MEDTTTPTIPDEAEQFDASPSSMKGARGKAVKPPGKLSAMPKKSPPGSPSALKGARSFANEDEATKAPQAAPKVRMQLPEGGEEKADKPASPATQRRGRVRGMSAVKKFEQEYMPDFIKDFTEKVEKKTQAATTQPGNSTTSQSPRSKAPMPGVVDLWHQVKELKEEALVLKKSEAQLTMDKDELNQRIKSLEWAADQANKQRFIDVERQEAQTREHLECAYSSVRLALTVLMHDTEPVEQSEKFNTEMFAGKTQEELHRHLSMEIERREAWEQEMREGGGDQVAALMERLQETQGEVTRATEKIDQLEGDLLKREGEMGRLSALAAEGRAEVSRMETQLLLKDAELRKMQSELDELRSEASTLDEDKKRLADAHKRLAEAEMKAIQSTAAVAAAVTAGPSYDSPPASPSKVSVLALARDAYRAQQVSSPRSRTGYSASPRNSASPRHNGSPRRDFY